MDRDLLRRLADHNLVGSWSALTNAVGRPPGSVDTLALFTTGIQEPFFNGAMPTGVTADPGAALEETARYMESHGVPWMLRVLDGTDEALEGAATATGLERTGGPPAMALWPIPPARPAPDDLRIETVDDPDGLVVHRNLLMRAFDMNLSIGDRLIGDALVDDPDIVIVVGYVDDTPVSTALVFVSGTTAGIYNVGTPFEHQRHGYGRAVTRAAIDEGVRRGCDHSILQSSDAGRPVYEAMGFVEIGRYHHFVDVSA